MKWMFPALSENGAEGLSDAGLEIFKGDIVRALAREVCQNSLDAQNDESKPVRVVFQLETIRTTDFPGTEGLIDVIKKCEIAWSQDKNAKTQNFIRKAKEVLHNERIKVLRISDYNTKGLIGAYDTETMQTPWKGLVKSSGMSVKSSGNAAGSYGIGKNAPFVNSDIQTVFYRTYDIEEVRATQGVARLMSFTDNSYADGIKTRRSVGYFGADDYDAVTSIPMLDSICERTEYGTDLFIPAIKNYETGEWVHKMIGEILDSFLMAIYKGNLEVVVGNECLNQDNINEIIARHKRYIKEADTFYKVLRAPDSDVYTDSLPFNGMGHAKIRLLYQNNLNQQILVVRNSVMKIAEIPRLPRTIQFSGILELHGDKLNEFFREMETPQHNKWEPRRHPTDSDEARRMVDLLEKWVRNIIDEKASENIEEEVDIDNIRFLSEKHGDDGSGNRESLIDSSISTEFKIREKVKRSYSSLGRGGNDLTKGFVDESGDAVGYRHRTGRNGGSAKGRNALINPMGDDNVKSGKKYVDTKARIVKKSSDTTRIILMPSEGIKDAIMEIKTKGENGKSLPLAVQGVHSETTTAFCKNGKVYIDEIIPNERAVLDLIIGGNQNFALGVTVYGNKE